MTRSGRIIVGVMGLGFAALLTGCQARQMVNHYLSFDSLITDLYEKHVLYNLARRDNGRTMVQMSYHGFSANLNTNFGTSGKVQFFTNPDDEVMDGTNISLNMFRQSFEPNISNSTGTGLNISSGPAGEQEGIRALYDEQVNRPADSRVYRRTGSLMVAMRGYSYVRTNHGELYYVPQQKHREFADFVHKVSFYKPAPPPAPAAGPTQPVTQPTSFLEAAQRHALATASQPAATQPAPATQPAATQTAPAAQSAAQGER